MVTLTNKQVLDALLALNGLADLKIPPKAALKVRKLHRAVQEAWEDVETIRKKMVEEYTEKDGEGKPVQGEPINGQTTYKLTKEGESLFNAAWLDLMKAPVDLNVSPLTIADLGSTEVQAGLLIGLGPLLDEEV